MEGVGHVVFSHGLCADTAQAAVQVDQRQPRNGLGAGNAEFGIGVAELVPVESISNEDGTIESDPGFIDDGRADRARPVERNILRAAEIQTGQVGRQRATASRVFIVTERVAR